MRFYPKIGKASTIELAQLAAQDAKKGIVGRLTFYLRVPMRASLDYRGAKWQYMRLPSRAIRFEVKSTTDLWEFFRGIKWILDHKTTWRRYLKVNQPEEPTQ